MRYSHLAFVRAKYSILHEIFYQARKDPLSFYPDPYGPRPVPTILAHEVLIFCVAPDPNEAIEISMFGRDGAPSWVDSFEVVEVGVYSCHAPREMVWDEEWEEEIEVHRTSESIVRDLFPVSEPRPARARKLLIVQCPSEAEESDVTRLDNRVRRALVNVRSVWQGKLVRAYCFTHDLRCRDVAEALSGIIDHDEVDDYLMVEPLAVPFSSLPLSPLKDWVERDFARLPKATLPHRRTRRSGQRGS